MATDTVSRIIDFAAHGDRVVFHGAGPPTRYAQLRERVEAIGAWLIQTGVRPGQPVALVLPKSETALLVFLGVLRIGAVAVPVNPAQPLDAMNGILARAAPKLVVAHVAHADGLQGDVRPIDAQWLSSVVATYESEVGHSPDDPGLTAQDPALILFTSGTTGAPKGVVHSIGSLTATAASLADVWQMRAEDVLLHVLPTHHAHGLVVSVFPMLARGASMVVHGSFDPRRILRDLPATTVMMGVPFHYQQLLQTPGFAQAAQRIRLFTCGSAPLPAALGAAFRSATGKDLAERYGMTETMITTANPADAIRPGTVGRALPGVDLRFRDLETGDLCEPGTVGELELRGPSVFSDYVGADLGDAVLDEGFFRTGDLGVLDSDGYVVLRGRCKDLIIYCGMNIYPADVEAELEALPEVAAACVFGTPDPTTGEAVYAAVIGAPGHAVKPAEIRMQIAARMAAYRVPRRIFEVDAFPRNAMGKIQRDRLRQDLMED